jgi:radical SAM superfamily enzyme YgiQ (UPF0313 family)
MPGIEDYRARAEMLSAGSLLLGEGIRLSGNPPWEEAGLRILILRLSPFPDIARSSPHLFLQAALRQALPDALIDLAFTSTRHDRALLEGSGLAPEFGILSGRPIRDFDIILISNSFLLEILNLRPLLGRAGIPPTALSRAAASKSPWPLILLGGSNAGAAYALYEDPFSGKGDCLVDAVFFGEGEARVAEMGRFLSKAIKEAGLPSGEARLGLMRRLEAEVEGFHAADSEAPTRQAIARLEGDGCGSLLEELALPLNSSEAATLRLGISRGCPSYCAFCMEAWDRKPYREEPLAGLVARAAGAKARSGADTLELASFNFNAHSDLVPLLIELNRLFLRVNAMSQRADILARAPGLLQFELAGGKRSFTVGVEGISSRMRARYAKDLDSETLERLFVRLLDARAREIKLFYIISGDERERDIREFSESMRTLKYARNARSPGTRIICSAGYLVQMPGTPFEVDQTLRSEDALRAVAGPVKAACETNAIEFRLSGEYREYRATQILADSSMPGFRLLEAFADEGLEYLGFLPRGADAILDRVLSSDPPKAVRPGRRPLPFLIRPVDDSFRSAYTGNPEASSCLGRACLGCGACPAYGPEMAAILSHALPSAGERDIETLRALLKAKAALPAIGYWIDIPGNLAGCRPEYLGAWALRCLMEAHPSQVRNVLEAREILFSSKAWAPRAGRFYGRSLFALRAWDAEAMARDADTTPGWRRRAEALPPSASLAPERFKARISIPESGLAHFEKTLSGYLSGCGVPFMLSRAQGLFRIDVPAKGLKKRVIAGAEAFRDTEAGTGPGIRLEALAHFDFKHLSELYQSTDPDHAGPLSMEIIDVIELS